jgi:hypothetical protein
MLRLVMPIKNNALEMRMDAETRVRASYPSKLNNNVR